MLSQDFVLALLQAGVTGAGLVLAVYALIIPLARRLFGYRAEEIADDIRRFKREAEKTGTRISQEEVDELRGMLDSIAKRKDFPSYLSSIAGVSFTLYVGSALMGVWWILDWNKAFMDNWLPVAFGLATILFLIIGILSIKDISHTMKKEFEELKEKVEETKSEAWVNQKD